jgi:hypothetical protein
VRSPVGLWGAPGWKRLCPRALSGSGPEPWCGCPTRGRLQGGKAGLGGDMLINSGGSHGAASSAHILSACLARLPPHKRRPLLSRPLGSPLQAGPTCVAASGHEDVDGRVLRQAVHPRQVAVVVADHLQGGSTRRQQVKDQRADQAGAGRQEHAITYLAALQCARQALQGKHVCDRGSGSYSRHPPCSAPGPST